MADIVFKPNSKAQEEFLSSPEHDVLFGGASGSGKSQVLIIDPIHAGYVNYSGFTAIYYRETYPQLEQALLPVARTYYEAAGAKYNEQKKIFTFPSGATIQLGYLQHPDDWRNYMGNEQCGQYFDEITNVHWENISMLRAWNRSRAQGIIPYRRSASNPGGISHQQCKNYYVDTCPPVKDGQQKWSELGNMWWQPMKAGETYYHVSENGLVSTRRFIPARIFDNRDLLKNNPEYLQGLLSLSPDRRRALLEGDWTVFEGQFFDLRSDIHVVQPVKEIPDRFPICAGLDFGRETRLEVAFRDYEGNIILFAEHAPRGDTPSERAEELSDFLLSNKLYKLLIIYDVTLAQVNDWLGYEKSPLAVFREVLYARMGDKAPILVAVSKKKVEDKRWRVACNEAFKDYLRYRVDEHGKLIRRPKFYVTTDCKRFIENVPSLIHDPNSYGGLDYDQKNNPQDHDFEAFKPVLMKLRTPERPAVKESYKSLDEYMEKEVFQEIHENAGKVAPSWTRL